MRSLSTTRSITASPAASRCPPRAAASASASARTTRSTCSAARAPALPPARRGASTPTRAAVVALPTGKFAVVCGPSPALVDPATGTLTPLTITAPAGCGAAVTHRHLVIAADATAQVFDATTLAPIAQPALVAPRAAPDLIALPNGQVLSAGGTDPTGKPIATLELFTPEPQSRGQPAGGPSGGSCGAFAMQPQI